MRNVSKLIIFNGTQLLLLKKKKSKIKYSLLGGGVKKKETSEEAVLREAKEEGNIDIGTEQLKLIKSIVFKDKDDNSCLYHYYLIHHVKKYELLEPHKFDALEWVEYHYGLSKLKERDRKIIEKYVINKKKIETSSN